MQHYGRVPSLALIAAAACPWAFTGLVSLRATMQPAPAHHQSSDPEPETLVEQPTDGQAAAFMLGVELGEAPHQMVVQHEVELAAREGWFLEHDLGGEG